MKIKTKALVIIACAVMLVTVGIMGTIAYLTTSASVENTFTVGKVEITLDEAKVDENGKALTGDKAKRVKENTYNILPGCEYDKDPTVTVKAGSAKCYVRLKITFVNAESFLDYQYGTPIRDASEDWEVAYGSGSYDAANDIYTFYTYYKSAVEPSDTDTVLDPVFKGFDIPELMTAEQYSSLNGATITVRAEAIQAEGFDTEEEAWASFDAQNK
jgi:predicted ribosomally synthesized peptide with SipW-like signal peptide